MNEFGTYVLLIADSVREIIASIQLKITLLKDNNVDFIITDQSEGNKCVYENLKQMSLFENIYFFYAHKFPETYRINYNKEIIDESDYKDVIDSVIPNKKIYNCFISSELDVFTRTVYACMKSRNQNIVPYILSEGIYGYIKDGIKLGIKRRLNAVDTKFPDFLTDYKGVIMNRKELCVEKYNTIIEYPQIRINNEVLCILNKAFGYKSASKPIQNKIIFFEESYVQDGGFANDVDFVQDLLNRYGKENIMVKLHPRSKTNRFKNIGVSFYEKNELPWELVLINGDCKNCVFMSINSGSTYLPVFEKIYNGKIIMLCDVLKYRTSEISSHTLSNYYSYLKCNIYNMPQIIVPKTKEDINNAIHECIISNNVKLNSY